MSSEVPSFLRSSQRGTPTARQPGNDMVRRRILPLQESGLQPSGGRLPSFPLLLRSLQASGPVCSQDSLSDDAD